MHKKDLKFALDVELAKLKFTYITDTKIAKARPLSVEWQTDSSVQKQWFMTCINSANLSFTSEVTLTWKVA